MSDVEVTFNSNQDRVIKLNELGGKDNRFVKLQEEMGELSDALLEGAADKIAEEGIDVLLMLQSIFADHFPDSSAITTALKDWFVVSHELSTANNVLQAPMLYRAGSFLKLSMHVGKVASGVQIVTKVHSSQYKVKQGFNDGLRPMFDNILDATLHVVDLICSTGMSIAELQQIHTNKMDKWERVAK